MTTGAAGDGLFRCVFEGCISSNDMAIDKRPYHRNCGCALHKSRGHCSHTRRSGMNVSYPIRRSWSEGCLALAAASASASASAGSASSTPSSSSPAVAIMDLQGPVRSNSQLGLFREEDEEDEDRSKV